MCADLGIIACVAPRWNNLGLAMAALSFLSKGPSFNTLEAFYGVKVFDIVGYDEPVAV